ncbi:MAG: hypothetical protein Q9207_002470 [Kuettlingeria erythrocarpa]
MPTLKQLTCTVEWSASGPSLPLQEYGTAYSDGLVETYVALPPIPTPFSIRLKSDGYIAPGLSLFVYIDGEYQCNRGRNNLQIPAGLSPKKLTEVDFIVRQKEEPLPGGGFMGRQWRFGNSEASNGTNESTSSSVPQAEYMGTIEVVVLRSAELQRTGAPGPSTSEKHPLTFDLGLDDAKASLSDLGGLFDGSSDCREQPLALMPFGGDGAWDDDGRDHSPFGSDWSNASGANQQQKPSVKQDQTNPRSTSPNLPSNPAGSPAIIINVNQPAAASPAPWAAAEPQPWNAPARSVADSWASTPAPGSVLGSYARQSKPDASWQTWLNDDAKPPKRSSQTGRNIPGPVTMQNNAQQSSSSSSNDSKNKSGTGGGTHNINGRNNGSWSASSRRGRNSRPQTQSVPGPWGQANQKRRSRDRGNGDDWNNQGGNTSTWDAPKESGHESKNDWNKNANEYPNDQNNGNGWNDIGTGNNNQSGDWSNDQSGDNQGNWDFGGANDHPADDNGWGNGENNDSNWNNNDNQDSGAGWNTDQNNPQGADNWDTNNNSSGNDNQNNIGWGNNNSSGNDWNNANAGAQETQAWNGQDRYTAGSNQDRWNQEGGRSDSVPANAGGNGEAKNKSRRESSGKVKSTTPSLSKQASMNATAQKLGWGHSSATGVNQASQPSAPPGAWPDSAQNAAASSKFENGSTGITKPYHVTLDAAGNPRLSDLQPAPAPAPPTPPPVQLATHSVHVSKGEPALYQHKANLSKEELIAEVIKIKSRANSKADSASNSSLPNAPASVNNFPNDNGNGTFGPTPSGNGFGATLNDKLAGLAAQNNDNSISSNGSQKSNQGWYNNGPPGSPLANNDNGHGPPTPNWGTSNNNNNWSGQPSGGGPVENWLDKTPAGASHGSHKGGTEPTPAWKRNGNGNGDGWGGSQKSKGGNKGSGGRAANNNNGSGGAIQRNGNWCNNGGGSGGQTTGWNGTGNDGGGGGGGWNTADNGQEATAGNGEGEPVW